jgi:hypothetical protein
MPEKKVDSSKWIVDSGRRVEMATQARRRTRFNDATTFRVGDL